MLSFSSATGYAVLALTYVYGQEGSWVLANEIAAHTSIPKPYLSKIMHALHKAGLVRAKRGYRGGYAMARSAEEITLLDVVEAIEGAKWKTRCLLGAKSCRGHDCCPTYRFWSAEKGRIEAELRRVTLAGRSQTCWEAQAGDPPRCAKMREDSAKPARERDDVNGEW